MFAELRLDFRNLLYKLKSHGYCGGAYMSEDCSLQSRLSTITVHHNKFGLW